MSSEKHFYTREIKSPVYFYSRINVNRLSNNQALEYKYCEIFVLVLLVICILLSGFGLINSDLISLFALFTDIRDRSF